MMISGFAIITFFIWITEWSEWNERNVGDPENKISEFGDPESIIILLLSNTNLVPKQNIYTSV